MSFEEKRAWIYAVITITVPAAYFTFVLGQVSSTRVTEIAYGWPLLVAVGVAVALNIGGDIIASIFSPGEAGKKDERDAGITRFAQFVEYYVLVVGVVAALGLTVAEQPHFWIANLIYLAFVLSSIAGAAARIVSYRRGFAPW